MSWTIYAVDCEDARGGDNYTLFVAATSEQEALDWVEGYEGGYEPTPLVAVPNDMGFLPDGAGAIHVDGLLWLSTQLDLDLADYYAHEIAARLLGLLDAEEDNPAVVALVGACGATGIVEARRIMHGLLSEERPAHVVAMLQDIAGRYRAPSAADYWVFWTPRN